MDSRYGDADAKASSDALAPDMVERMVRGRQASARRRVDSVKAAPPAGHASRHHYDSEVTRFESGNYAHGGATLPMPVAYGVDMAAVDPPVDALDQLDGIIAQQQRRGQLQPGMKVRIEVVDPKTLRTVAKAACDVGGQMPAPSLGSIMGLGTGGPVSVGSIINQAYGTLGMHPKQQDPGLNSCLQKRSEMTMQSYRDVQERLGQMAGILRPKA